MSDYNTDTIDHTPVTKDARTGLITKGTPELGVQCRVETYNGMINNKEGKEEKGNYLILINNSSFKIGDLITVKTVMGISIDKKEFDIKKVFYAGGCNYTHSEVYL